MGAEATSAAVDEAFGFRRVVGVIGVMADKDVRGILEAFEPVLAEVVVTVGDLEIVSAITRTSAEQLNLQPGEAVKAVIKSTEVMVAKESSPAVR